MTAGYLQNIARLAAELNRPVKLMEVCGTHTMAAFRSGLRTLLPPSVKLLSGPGCPVCVTPDSFIDRAIAITEQPDTVAATFGDMLRVPGTETSLERARAAGARVQVVYSPLDALQLAADNPDSQVVFLGVGFETTAPGVAWTIKHAAAQELHNYTVLCAHKTMPRAMAGLLAGGEVRIDGFMCPGHVSVIIGAQAYGAICSDYHIPCVVAGFEPADMAAAIEMLLRQRIESRAEVEIQYARSVTDTGNAAALEVIREVFEATDTEWRGLGSIPGSGLSIRPEYAKFDAETRFGPLKLPSPRAASCGCICGDVLRGLRTPFDCPLFRTHCTPAAPVGACMVSSEGTCAAYFRYAVQER